MADSLAQGDSDAEDRGQENSSVAANVQEMGHRGRKEVKFGDEGDAKMLSVEVTDVTKPPVALSRIIEKENKVHFGSSDMRETEKFQRGRRRDRHRGQRRRSFGSETGGQTKSVSPPQ